MDRKYDLSSIMPHAKPMILIDDIVDFSIEEKWMKTCVTINEKSLFFDKSVNGIDSSVGIEYMAQTIACYAYFRANLSKPKVGFLLGTRLYNNSIKTFEKDKMYYILVKEVFVAEIYSFECFIYNDKNDEIASATINVLQSSEDNIEEMLNV